MPRTTWPPYQTLRPLIHAHLGRPAVVIGGGPSRLAAMPQTPLDAIFISVNAHGCRHFAAAPDPVRRVSYAVACDKLELQLRPYGVPIVGRHMYADYRILASIATSSGMTAAYVARLMGCAPIILVGMDCYEGATYADDPTAKSTGKLLNPKEHAGRWWKLAQSYPGMYRTIGCHHFLQLSMGEYSAAELPYAPVPREQLERELQAVRCEITRPATVLMRTFEPGTVLELARKEVEQLLREKKGRRL